MRVSVPRWVTTSLGWIPTAPAMVAYYFLFHRGQSCSLIFYHKTNEFNVGHVFLSIYSDDFIFIPCCLYLNMARGYLLMLPEK